MIESHDRHGKPFVSNKCYDTEICSEDTSAIVGWIKRGVPKPKHEEADRWRVGYCARHTEQRHALANNYPEWEWSFETYAPVEDVESDAWDE